MKFLIKGHDNPDVDSVVSGYLLAKVISALGYDANFIIPDSIDEEIINLCMNFSFDPRNFKVNEYDKLAQFILVDHFEDDKLNVIAVVDHHETNKDLSNIDYWYEKASSTSCMIGRKFEEFLDKNDIALACLAGFVDTASFHSTKSRESDHIWIKEMCFKYNLDYQKMYDAGLCLTDISNLDKAYLNGVKKYRFNEYNFEASYIQVKTISEEQLKYILSLVSEYVKKYNLLLFAFIVHDMENFKTKVYRVSKNDIEVDDYDVYTSRGNVIIPSIMKMLINKGH